jgi:hypothetical protein
MIPGYSHVKLCREAIQLSNEMIGLNFVQDKYSIGFGFGSIWEVKKVTL